MSDTTTAAVEETVEPETEVVEAPLAESEQAPDAEVEQAEADAGNDAEQAEQQADEAPATPQPSATEATNEIQPFAFKAYGKDWTPTGAVVTGNYVAFPKDTFNREILPNFVDSQVVRQTIADLKRQVTERDPERNPEVLKARELMKQIGELVRSPSEELAQRAYELQQMWPVYEAQAEAASLRAQLEARQSKESEAQTEEQRKQWVPVLQNGLKDRISTFLQQDTYKDLGLDTDALFDAVWQLGERAFVEDEQGQIFVNDEVLQHYIDRDAKLARKYTEQIEAERKRVAAATQAQQANAKVLNQNKKVPATTAVSAKGSPAPARGEKMTFKTRQEYQDYMEKKYGI